MSRTMTLPELPDLILAATRSPLNFSAVPNRPDAESNRKPLAERTASVRRGEVRSIGMEWNY